MSFSRFYTVFSRDLTQNTKRVMFWVWLLLLVFLAFSFSKGVVRIQSGDSSVGGTKSIITSEFAVTQLLIILAPLIYGFFVSVISGMSIIQDEEHRLGEVLHATPLRPGEYIWAKFLAVLATSFLVLTIHLAAMIFFNHIVPAGGSAEFRGPLVISNYVRPALLFVMPTIVLFAGITFAVGEWTRRPILVFFLPLAIFLGCIFFLWEFSPSWLDPRIDRFLMLIDPAGFRWLNESLLKVDRGVSFYNGAHVPLDLLIIVNRLLALGIGLGAVLLSQRHFAKSLRGVSRRAESAWRKGAMTFTTALAPVPSPQSRKLSGLAMTARRPGLLSGTWTVMRAELIELRSSPGLYLFVPLLVLQGVGPSMAAVGAFDTPLLLTSGTFAARSLAILTVMTCLLLLFYTVESLLRERHSRLAAISMATPVKTGSILLGKTLANSVIGLSVLFLELGAAAILLLIQGKVRFQIMPFFLIWGLLLVPTLILWTSFVMATVSITRNRYATYAIAIAVIGFTGYKQIVGELNWLGNWPLWTAVQWSDISILQFDRSALILNRVMALGMAALFITLTAKFYPRRDPDATGLVQRMRPASLFMSALSLLPVALIPITAGSILWAKVEQGFQGEGPKKLLKDYWRKNLATYRDWPLPDITAVDLSVDFEPKSAHMKVAGSYDLINNHDKPLTQIPITGAPHWKSVSWTYDDKPNTPDYRSGLYVFTPLKPIPSGGTARIGFKFEGSFPDGITKNGGGNNEFILPTAIVLTSFGTSFAPTLGFLDQVGVDKDNSYESKEFPDDYYNGQTESFVGSRKPFRTKVKISGPDDLVYNSVGTKTSEDVQGGRRTTVWESDQPVNFFNIVAGRWEVRKGKDTAVYYHKQHAYNVDEMVEALDAARKYYSEWFRPYPWQELKLSEFPALASYAQGFPTDITFSESIGFLTQSDPKANAAFMVTAHEAAHQWWGNMVAPGKGPGGNLLSEGTSHFATMLLFDQIKGPRGRMEFARKIEDSYAKGRSSDSERPLVKIDGTKDGDQTVTYDKAGWVFWMLLNHMGRDRMLEGVRDYFEVYHNNPDHPVLQDFLAVMRPHAKDPIAFDAFTQQWFFRVVVPEYDLTEPRKTREGDTWEVSVRVKNVGTGRMPIEVAATTGERYGDDGRTVNSSYHEARKTVTLGSGESEEIRIKCDFDPAQIVVDPDVKVLMLRRKAAVTKF